MQRVGGGEAVTPALFVTVLIDDDVDRGRRTMDGALDLRSQHDQPERIAALIPARARGAGGVQRAARASWRPGPAAANDAMSAKTGK